MSPPAATANYCRKAVAWLPMYACYYFGEACFQIVNRWPDGWSDEEGSLWDRLGSKFFDGYQWGMSKSLDINDWAGFRLWYKADDELPGP
jgi:hypothetical protein